MLYNRAVREPTSTRGNGGDASTVVAARPSPSATVLRVIGATERQLHPLPSHGRVVIGRGKTSDIRVDDASISRQHLALTIDDGFRVEDLGSANGTRIGARTIAPGESLKVAAGELIELGSIAMVIEQATPAQSPRQVSGGATAIERLHALAERDGLRHKLLLAEEEERRRLSRELHDEAGQLLTALGLGLQALSDVAVPGSEADRRATQLRELASTLGRELHAIAVRIRPKSLDDFGLEAALATYAEEWSRQSGIAIDIHAQPGAQRLPGPIESAIYRVVQEALTNISRHSGARHASIVVERRDGQVIAVVEDDGHGFDPDDDVRATKTPALGLLGVRERVELLGGTVALESSRSGTSLYVRIPIGNSDGARA